METASITVRVLFFGGARDAAGHDEIDVSLNSPANTESARSQILSQYPELQRFGNSLLLAVNQRFLSGRGLAQLSHARCERITIDPHPGLRFNDSVECGQ